MHRYTHIGRFTDPRIPSNLLAIVATLATGAAVLVLGHGPQSLIPAAGGVYLAWLIGREIDPDRVLTANASAIVSSGLMIFEPAASVGALALVGLAARISLRSTGKPPLPTDLGVLLVAAVVISIGSFAWVAAVALAVAVVLDARGDIDTEHAEVARRRMLWGAAIGVAPLLAAGLTETGGWDQPESWMWSIVGAGVAGGAVLSRFEPVRSTADLTREPLHPDRLRLARLMVLTTAAVTTIVGGAAGAIGIAPAWIVLAVAGLLRAIGTSWSEPLAP